MTREEQLQRESEIYAWTADQFDTQLAFKKGAEWAIQATIDWLEWLQRTGSARGGEIVEEMIEDYKRKML